MTDDEMFALTPDEERLIDMIMVRAVSNPEDRLHLEMSLRAYHNVIGKLDLAAMANWRYLVDVMHDVYGIHRHLNKKTMKIEGVFSPRFLVRERNGGCDVKTA